MSTSSNKGAGGHAIYRSLDWGRIYELYAAGGRTLRDFYRTTFMSVAGPELKQLGRVPSLSCFKAHMAREARRRGLAPVAPDDCAVRVARIPDEAFGEAGWTGEVRIDAAGASVSFSSAQPELSAALAAAHLMRLMGGAQ